MVKSYWRWFSCEACWVLAASKWNPFCYLPSPLKVLTVKRNSPVTLSKEKLCKIAKWKIHKDVACLFERVLEGSSILKNNNCMVTYHRSYKPPNKDEQDMMGAAWEVRSNSKVSFSHGLLYMNPSVLAEQQWFSFISSMRILDTA